MPNIKRSPLALARDEWLDSPEGRQCCEGSAHGQYLRNRLIRAFLAGVEAAEAGKTSSQLVADSPAPEVPRGR